ncbi:hypothetical protein [Embleya sp. NBC_00896]|uniref:hypothetical protein n=1 Tax=Embleya sp. NBC_00896 TaxID=2975961 RepID=UPI002F918F52|nr:hypothetical protein OG928_48175 [Embleya sp. NBC_00896]
MNATNSHRRAPFGTEQDLTRHLQLAALASDTHERERILQGLRVAGARDLADRLENDIPAEVTL